jgi:hypothetical protein
MTEPARNAIRKALALRAAAAVRRSRHGRYEVESGTRAGHYHTVTHDRTGRGWACSCEARRHGVTRIWTPGELEAAQGAAGEHQPPGDECPF